MEERDAFELQLRALKAEVDSITRRLAGTEAGAAAADGPGQVEPPQQGRGSRRRTTGGVARGEGEEAEQPRGASPLPIPVPMVPLSSTLQPGVVVAPRSPPKIVRRHPAPKSNHGTQPAAPSSSLSSATRRPRPSSAPPLMACQDDHETGPDGENDEGEEEVLMAWVAGAKTPAAQFRRAGQALRELLRERDAALQGLQQAQGECAGLRARVRELEGLEQDLATLKIALESSERIRLQQKGLLDTYKAQQQQQHQHRHQPDDKGIPPPPSAPHLTHHDVPPTPATPPPAPAVADAAWVNQFFLDYSLRHPDPPPPPAHSSDALLLTPAVVSSPGSARSSASSRQKKVEAARLARRLRGDADGPGAGGVVNHYASGGAASATAASLRRASAAGLVLGAGARRPELSEESLQWRRYPDGEEDERGGGGWSRPGGGGGSSSTGGKGAGQGKPKPSGPSPASESGGKALPAASRARAGVARTGASSASSSANTSASSLASAAGGIYAPVQGHMNGPTSAFAPAPGLRRKALAAAPATAGASPFDSPATTTSGTRPSSASSLATKGPSPGGGPGPASAEGKGKGKTRRAGVGGTGVAGGRSKDDAARLWS